jgi:hypothetical protein
VFPALALQKEAIVRFTFVLVLGSLVVIGAQQGGVDLSPRAIGEDSSAYTVHYSFIGLRPDTAYNLKIRLRPPGGGNAYYGYTYNRESRTWLSQNAPWARHPVARTNSAGALAGWAFGWNARHSPAAVDDSLQLVLRLAGGSTNVNPTVKPLVDVVDLKTQGGWLYGHVYKDQGCTQPHDNGHVLAYRGTQLAGMYTTEKNGVLEGFDSLNVGYFRIALGAGVIDSLQVRDFANNRLASYERTSPPWSVRAGDSTSVDPLRVGEQEVSAAGGRVRLFPNPCRRWLRISAPPDVGYSVTVYSACGRRVRDLPPGVTAFDCKALPSGVYFFELKVGDHRQVRSVRLVD